jgi:catechol 2,3-dioxygenase-like lactoylglutathione lyase family enzyme
MDNDVPDYSVHSVLLSVRDLGRSTTFYQAVLNLREVLRQDRVAVLAHDERVTFTLFLRLAHPEAVHFGQEALGVRSLTYNVGSLAELDRVEKALRAFDAFRDRLSPPETAGYRWVRGYDPDRYPLAFMACESGERVSLDDLRRAIAGMYAVDV